MSDDGSDNAPSPFRRPMFILSAGFLAVIIVLAAFMVRSSLGDDSGTPEATPPATAAAPPSGDGACRPTDTNQQIPTSPPPGVSWQVFKGLALPASAAAGPLVTDGDVVRCFARTPAGALIAATQISARVEFADGWQQVADQSVIAGPGRSAFLREHAKATASQPTGPGSLAQVTGYKFVTYTTDVAVIDTVVRAPTSGSLASSITTVKWVDGDWKLELQPDGSVNSPPRLIQTLDGYVPWGGV